jgi:hypothetical protein
VVHAGKRLHGRRVGRPNPLDAASQAAGVPMTRHIRPERLRTLVKAALPGIVYSMETRPDGSKRLVAKWKE